jgi:hypothetical protein
MDRDVERILVFMQDNIRAPKLMAVAHAVAKISDLIWAQYADGKNDPDDRCQPFGFIVGSDNFKAAQSSERSPDATLQQTPDPSESKKPNYDHHKMAC